MTLIHKIIIAASIAAAVTITMGDEPNLTDQCFTDSCVGCIDDCLDAK